MIKRIVFLLIVFCCFQNAQSQIESSVKGDESNEIYNSNAVESLPEYPGGINEFYRFIGKKYRVPNIPDLKGRIYIAFVVDKDGSLTDFKIQKDIGYGTGEEAIRVLKLSPKWIPAVQNGRPVRCAFVIPLFIQGSR